MLVLLYDLVKIALGLLFLISIFLIFNGDSIAGFLSLGIFGYIIVLIISTIIASIIMMLIPGILAGIITALALSGQGEITIIAGIVVFFIVTSIVFDLLFKLLIPFSIGFWLGMGTASIANT